MKQFNLKNVFVYESVDDATLYQVVAKYSEPELHKDGRCISCGTFRIDILSVIAPVGGGVDDVVEYIRTEECREYFSERMDEFPIFEPVNYPLDVMKIDDSGCILVWDDLAKKIINHIAEKKKVSDAEIKRYTAFYDDMVRAMYTITTDYQLKPDISVVLKELIPLHCSMKREFDTHFDERMAEQLPILLEWMGVTRKSVL